MKQEDGAGGRVPQHVAIIMDGNGRWAKKRMMPRTYGHAQGSRTVERICEDAWRMGIRYLTVYAFFHGKLEKAAGGDRYPDGSAPGLHEGLHQDEQKK